MNYKIEVSSDAIDARLNISDSVNGTHQDYCFPVANLVDVASLIVQDLRLAEATTTSGWIDALATHGIAAKGSAEMELTIIAAFQSREVREITYRQGGEVSRDLVWLLPRLWVMKWRQKRFNSAWLVTPSIEGTAFPTSIIDTETHFMGYPLGNTHTGGAVCWGTATPSGDFAPGAVAAVDNHYLNSVFNDDLPGMSGGIKVWLDNTSRHSINGRPNVAIMSLLDTAAAPRNITLAHLLSLGGGQR